MSNLPPPVQDSGSVCPNCGAYRPGNQSYCANCGYGQPSVATQRSNTAQIVWVLIFILIGLPAGCLGGCFLLIGTSTNPNSNDWPFWLMTLFAIFIAIGSLVMVILSSRKKK